MLLQLLLAACLIPGGCGTHQEAIHALVDAGAMDVQDDFRPHEPATRLETAEAMFVWFGLPPANARQFEDVDSVAADALAAEGIVAGFPDGTFGPDRPVSRGQVATMLRRVVHLGGELAGPVPVPFVDVTVGVGHGDAVGWLVSTGGVSGFGDGTFRPHDPVSRGQLATLLHGQDR